MEITFTASPPNSVRVSDAYEGTLVFNWTSPIQNCKSLSYQISSDCGSCTETTNTTTVNCSVGAITHETSNCTFSVQSVVCGRTGAANRPVIVTLKGIHCSIANILRYSILLQGCRHRSGGAGLEVGRKMCALACAKFFDHTHQYINTATYHAYLL